MAQSANISTLIIGGGPAGSAAAITLARAGMTPHLVERQSTPQNGVCGGFLGWDAIAALEELGIDPWSLGAHRITGFRLVSSSRRSCPAGHRCWRFAPHSGQRADRSGCYRWRGGQPRTDGASGRSAYPQRAV
jgi:2-polyprenyl-6-methoxyphenol hydroxylase-like FAD-dependent oxidoreductase